MNDLLNGRRLASPLLEVWEVEMAKRHSRPSAHYRYEHYDPR